MQIHKSITIQSTLDRVFDHMTDPRHFPEIWPSMFDVGNVTRTPSGGVEWDCVYKLAGLHFASHAKTVELEKNKKIVTQSELGIPSTFVWTYAREDGGVRVTLDADYRLPSTLTDAWSEAYLRQMSEREAEALLENLKLRMEVGSTP